MVKSIEEVKTINDYAIAEDVTLTVLNRIVRAYVKNARRAHEPLVLIMEQLKMAAHLASQDANRHCCKTTLYWTRHVEMVSFVYGYTHSAIESGTDLSIILSQLRLATMQGERDWLNETRANDPLATQEIEAVEVD